MTSDDPLGPVTTLGEHFLAGSDQKVLRKVLSNPLRHRLEDVLLWNLRDSLHLQLACGLIPPVFADPAVRRLELQLLRRIREEVGGRP